MPHSTGTSVGFDPITCKVCTSIREDQSARHDSDPSLESLGYSIIQRLRPRLFLPSTTQYLMRHPNRYSDLWDVRREFFPSRLPLPGHVLRHSQEAACSIATGRSFEGVHGRESRFSKPLPSRPTKMAHKVPENTERVARNGQTVRSVTGPPDT